MEDRRVDKGCCPRLFKGEVYTITYAWCTAQPTSYTYSSMTEEKKKACEKYLTARVLLFLFHFVFFLEAIVICPFENSTLKYSWKTKLPYFDKRKKINRKKRKLFIIVFGSEHRLTHHRIPDMDCLRHRLSCECKLWNTSLHN